MQPVTKSPFLQVSETQGSPITTPYGRITPVARAVKVRWRGGGFTWNRAVAVEVDEGQQLRRVPIRDATSRTIGAIALTGLMIAACCGLFLRRRRRTS
ncbi:MAG TPA: hypothetical protein VGT44_08100 [Ktedonobacteraceae bacterium]|nr:hypothetical protein [Ktedonobacteraceae bacterium]